MEAEHRVEEAKARQREILRQQALEKERQRAEELVKKQQDAYAAAAEAQGQRDRWQRWSKGEEKLNLELLKREQKMKEMKAREDQERMIREEARRNFFNQQEQARRNKMAIDAQMDGNNAPLRFPLQKKTNPSSFPPLEDYFIKPKQAASPAKPKRLLQRHSLTKFSCSCTQTGSTEECREKATLSQACHYNSRKRRNQLHNKNKVDDKKQRKYEEKLQQLELEKKARTGDKPWLTRGKMKDDEEAERRKVVKEAQMKEREKRDAERKAFQKLIAKKKKQNRSHSVSDEEDVILVAPNRHNAHHQQRKHQLVRLQPAQATPKKVAAASKEGSPQATHTPPKIGSSKGKVEREKEKRSEDVQRSSPFANVERGG
ncbi:hypothetical protein BLNAU_20152 [Blattamonas nauphoetae]|uniref:Uncharacterized protein n=1 Tax=Blattamonas nauphoetae TaxID=2049346 RepID=A0ABQ9WZH8_9EUKA|nr:hypothetical protein BLNAU_20152 [Blattamonas nauphoetae]